MASIEAAEVQQRSYRTSRSASGSRQSASGRSESKSPFKRNGGGSLLATLRQKFSIKAGRTRHGAADGCRHSDEAAAAATLCSSWRSRPRHVDKPIRPAYSDECLSCCGRASCCLRGGLLHAHRTHASREFAVFEPQTPERTVSSSRKTPGFVICRHCHAKNDQSPSDFELSDREISQCEEDKVRSALPVDKEYGHACAPSTSAFPGDVVTVHSMPRDCVALSDGVMPSCSHSTSNHNALGADLEMGAVAAAFGDAPSVVPPMQPFYDKVKDGGTLPKGWSLSKELFRLSKHGWYWGPITRVEAEEKLTGQPDGSFLVRDSSDDRYLLSLSFRSFGRTLHTRIEHCNGVFSFYAQPESEGYSSIVDLIDHSMTDSQSGVFCYSRARMPGSPSFPVRLARPVSRFAQVRTLQYLCRFCIRQYTRVDHIQQLPLPSSIRGWLEEAQY